MSHRKLRNWLVIGLVAAGFAAAAAADEVRYDGHRLVQVTLKTPADLQTMLAISGDFWDESPHLGQMQFRVPPDRLADLQASGLAYRIVSEDIQQLIDRERSEMLAGGRGWFDAYKTNTEISAYIDTLVASRPDLASRFYVGDSLQGREIYGIRISSPVGANKPALLFNGCQHAREWVSPMTVMYIADQLIAQYDTNPDIAELLDYGTFYIVPVVNPDGYQYTLTDRLWRKNRRNNGDGTIGVDLNRNWDANFGGPGSDSFGSSEIYHGPFPFSEPESAALRDFVLAHPDIVAYIDFHSYSQLVMYPWGYTSAAPPQPDRDLFIALTAAMADAIFDVHGVNYTDQQTSDLYLASGVASDWMYDSQDILGLSIELRPSGSIPGFVLPPGEIIPTGEENFAAIQVLARAVTLPLAIDLSDAPNNVLPAGQPNDFVVFINDVNATYAPGTGVLYASVNGGPFNSSPLVAQGGNQYLATLPAAPCDATVAFYVEAETNAGATVRKPAGGASAPLTALAQDISEYVSDTMETDSGWTVGAPGDNASTGIWNRMDPEGTAAQPEDDHTALGVNCWITDGRAGSSLGTYDVDGGATTLTSPVFDLSAANNPTISYWRWYSNDAGGAPNTDVFTIEINNGGGWTTLETVGPAGAGTAGGWIYAEFNVADFVAPTATVQVRFIASDEGSGSIVEAAIDDLQIRDLGCFGGTCAGDLTGDSRVDFDDFAALSAGWGGPGGDLTGDGTTNFDDFAVLSADWGCDQR